MYDFNLEIVGEWLIKEWNENNLDGTEVDYLFTTQNNNDGEKETEFDDKPENQETNKMNFSIFTIMKDHKEIHLRNGASAKNRNTLGSKTNEEDAFRGEAIYSSLVHLSKHKNC
ncbi:hypothetical protein TNCV_3519651 [Trichonephila clavipes]|uniref:Uncharacterized protein n=1 Tax=Trichonephila clavipes TaxID=2585209 RepID=A0A8X6SUF5_TRICX|nr:hypothetical protein TNCV_3519651 [Trichonephila clavipes]